MENRDRPPHEVIQEALRLASEAIAGPAALIEESANRVAEYVADQSELVVFEESTCPGKDQRWI